MLAYPIHFTIHRKMDGGPNRQWMSHRLKRITGEIMKQIPVFHDWTPNAGWGCSADGIEEHVYCYNVGDPSSARDWDVSIMRCQTITEELDMQCALAAAWAAMHHVEECFEHYKPA